MERRREHPMRHRTVQPPCDAAPSVTLMFANAQMPPRKFGMLVDVAQEHQQE
jgi:hypothetical protein